MNSRIDQRVNDTNEDLKALSDVIDNLNKVAVALSVFVTIYGLIIFGICLVIFKKGSL